MSARPERESEERSRWDELKALAAKDDAAGFWRRYADYLEWNNVVSESRQVIHRMARLTAELLND